MDMNDYTDKIRAFLLDSGKFYIVSTLINGQKYLRCTVMNPLTKKRDFEDLLTEIERVGELV